MIDTIYLCHHSHMDIGFTDLAEEVREQHLRYLDDVLAISRAHPVSTEFPFRWTCESAWIVEDYLRVRAKEAIDGLFELLRTGQMELMATFAQPITEMAGREEIIDSVRFAAELGKTHGFPVECAMINDIGGYLGRLPSILRGWGIKYLVAGVGAYQVHMPWCDLPHLFYLEDKAGQRILVWNLGIDRTARPQDAPYLDAVYYMGGTYLMDVFKEDRQSNHDRSAPRQSLFSNVSEAWKALENRLTWENYPYREVLLQYGKDNGPPDPELPLLMKELRDHFIQPKIIGATPTAFFKILEEKYANQIPVVRGVISDPWVIRANPQPTALARHREAQKRLHSAELRGIQAWRHSGLTPSDSTPIYRALHLFTDHTFGLNEWGWQAMHAEPRTRDGAFDRFRRSWLDKAFYADRAVHLAKEIDREAKERIVGGLSGPDSAIIVWNDQTLPLSGLAEFHIPKPRVPHTLISIRDRDTDTTLRFQRTDPRTCLVEVPAVPTLGYRVLLCQWNEHEPYSSETALNVLPNCPATLETDAIRVSFDSRTGCIQKLVDLSTGKTWFTQTGEYGLGEFRYALVDNVSASWKASGMAGGLRHQWIPARLERTWTTGEGPLMKNLLRERVFQTSECEVRVTEEIRLYPGQSRVDFSYRLDKPETARKESAYVWFGFDLPNAAVRYDQAVGWVEPRAEFVAGAMQDSFYCADWANLSNESCGITLVCHEAPLIQAGYLRTYEWKDGLPFREEAAVLIGWPYHNLQQTDNPIWQELLQTFRYSLLLHPASTFDVTLCDLAAAQAQLPMPAQLISTSTKHLPGSWIQIESPTVRLNGGRLLPDGQTILLRLEEREGKEEVVRISFNDRVLWACKSDFFADRGAELTVKGNSIDVPILGHELATLLIQMMRK